MEPRSEYRLTVGQWSQLRAMAAPIRELVFVQEQAVPLEMEQDEFDATALHAVVQAADDRPIATGRIVFQPGEALPGVVGRIGRLAVLEQHRGRGVGTMLLSSLLDCGLKRGIDQFELHAQLEAAPLYQRHGFVPHGAVFDEAGIDHVLMVRVSAD